MVSLIRGLYRNPLIYHQFLPSSTANISTVEIALCIYQAFQLQDLDLADVQKSLQIP